MFISAAADEAFPKQKATLAEHMLPDQFTSLFKTAVTMLDFLDAQSQLQPRPSTYSIHLPPSLGKHVFEMWSKKMDLYSREDIADYTQLLPAMYHIGTPNDPGTCHQTVSTSKLLPSQVTAGEDPCAPLSRTSAPLPASVSCQEAASKLLSALGSVASPLSASTSASLLQQPSSYDAVLTKLANSGLHEVSVDELCQKLWPTPSALAWHETQRTAAQLAAVILWMDSNSQHLKRMQADHQELWESLMQMLHNLLLGHVPDMSLDMAYLFRTVFEPVMQGWLFAKHLQPQLSTDEKHTDHVRQLGRAMLRRLAADEALAKQLFEHADDGSKEAAQCDSVVAAIKSTCTLMCKCGFVSLLIVFRIQYLLSSTATIIL